MRTWHLLHSLNKTELIYASRLSPVFDRFYSAYIPAYLTYKLIKIDYSMSPTGKGTFVVAVKLTEADIENTQINRAEMNKSHFIFTLFFGCSVLILATIYGFKLHKSKCSTFKSMRTNKENNHVVQKRGGKNTESSKELLFVSEIGPPTGSIPVRIGNSHVKSANHKVSRLDPARQSIKAIRCQPGHRRRYGGKCAIQPGHVRGFISKPLKSGFNYRLD